jgi:hypothetical protein
VPGSALTPQAAVERLGSTSGVVRAAVIFGERGDPAVHAEDEAVTPDRLRDLAEELFAAVDAAGLRTDVDQVDRVEVSRPDGGVFGVRHRQRNGPGPRTLVAVTGPGALSSLVFYDMRMALRDVGEEA